MAQRDYYTQEPDAASTRRHDTMPLATGSAGTFPPSRQAVALGLADAHQFDMRRYSGTPQAAVYELLRAGALDAWGEDNRTGARLSLDSLTMLTRLSLAGLTVFYRADFPLILCPSCDHVARQFNPTSPYCRLCDGTQPDGATLREYAPTSQQPAVNGPYVPLLPFPGYSQGQQVNTTPQNYDGIWSDAALQGDPMNSRPW